LNPYKKTTEKDKRLLKQQKSTIMIGEQFGSIQQNGYVSTTLKSVQLGQKSTFEWIGEEFLVP
jgi:hypothetical protein